MYRIPKLGTNRNMEPNELIFRPLRVCEMENEAVGSPMMGLILETSFKEAWPSKSLPHKPEINGT